MSIGEIDEGTKLPIAELQKQFRELQSDCVRKTAIEETNRKWLTIAGGFVLAALGYANFVSIPNEVQNATDKAVGEQIDREHKELLDTLEDARTQVETLRTSAKILGHLDQGTVLVGPSPSGSSKGAATFTREFASPPRILATVKTEPPYPDTFSVTTSNVSTKGFTISVVRTDAAVGWTQQLTVDWLAWQP